MSDRHNDLQDDQPRPFISVEEIQSIKIDEVKRGGLDPVAVALLVKRCAVTMEALLAALDAVHAERLDAIVELDTATANAAASLTATRVLEGAAEAAEHITREAAADAQQTLAEAEAQKAALVDEISQLVDRRDEILRSHSEELSASRSNADAQLSQLRTELISWRDDFAKRGSDILQELTAVFTRGTQSLSAPLAPDQPESTQDAGADSTVHPEVADSESPESTESPVFGLLS
jgi:ElaB/YqjD/DUF883 family membrane-anchored ribosome-binding protein